MTDLNKNLLRALSSRKWEEALVLLDKGADPTVRNAKGYNALLLLSDGASVEVDQPILQQLADMCLKKGCLLSDTANNGDTVMHLCAGNSGLFSHCLTYNPSCTTLSKSKKNILYYAARNPTTTVSVVEKCIALGADIHNKDNDGNNAFDYFLQHGGHGAHYLLSLINQGYNPTAVQIFKGCFVAFQNTTDADMMTYLKYAHQKGLDLNQMDDDGVSLLVSAVCNGRVHSVEYLLNHGARIEQIHTGQPVGMPLNNFDNADAVQLMDVLVQHGLNVNDTLPHLCEQTMVHQLMYLLPLNPFDSNRADELLARLRALMQYGGDLHKPEETGMTPLSLGLLELMDEYPNISQLDSGVQQYVNGVLDVFLEYGCDLNQIVGNGTGTMGALGQLLRRCELAELLEYKIAQQQHARILLEVDGATQQRCKKM